MKTVFIEHYDRTGEIPEVPCVTGCQCPRPEITDDNPNGIYWCEAHGRKKTARQWIKCQTEPGMFLSYRNDPPPPAAAVKPKTPCKNCGGSKIWDFAKSIAAFMADGCKTVTAEQYQERLAVCDGCENRVKARCAICGCFVAVKAKGRAWECPEGRWAIHPP